MRPTHAIAVLALLLFAAAPANAQRITVPGFDMPVCEGQISTFPLEPVRADGRYWVDIFDETEESLKFRDIFLETLRADGRPVERDGRLVFNFEAQSAFLGLVPRSGTDRQRLDDGVRDSGREVGVGELRDTIRDSGNPRRGRTALGRQLDAKAELRDEANGKVVWFATVNCTPLTGDRTLLMRFFSKVIVEGLSREGGKRTF